jgi:hypothetical protein
MEGYSIGIKATHVVIREMALDVQLNPQFLIRIGLDAPHKQATCILQT